jgi:hypothetical protein
MINDWFLIYLFSSHPDDIDLFIGTNHERIVPGGVVGAVSSCLFGLQFRNLKFGDRFFYTHEGQFTEGKSNIVIGQVLFVIELLSFVSTIEINWRLYTSMLCVLHEWYWICCSKSVPSAEWVRVSDVNRSMFIYDAIMWTRSSNPLEPCSQCRPFDLNPWRMWHSHWQFDLSTIVYERWIFVLLPRSYFFSFLSFFFLVF